MLTTLRRMFRVGVRHGFKLVGAFLILGYGLSLLNPSPAAADEKVDKWKTVALSDVAFNQRLMALEALKQVGSSTATDALADIAEGGDLRIAVAACAQLGRVKTSGSKGELKALLEKSSLSVHVRSAAASSIAEHWKDTGDMSYLEDKCKSNDDLKAHYGEIKERVYKGK